MSKELYNFCNFYFRKTYFSNQKLEKRMPLPDISSLSKLVENEACYKSLHNTKTAKQTIRKLISDWSTYFKTIKAYKKNPKVFLSCPKPPGYKKHLAQVIFYNETIKRKPLKQNIIIPTNQCFSIYSKIKDFKQVIITPKRFGFIIEVQYEITPKQHRSDKLDKGKVCCIDLGVNTLAAITTNQNTVPILINGRVLKSINQWYNKNPSKRRNRKRYWRMENYFHHTSKFIIEYCLKNGIGKIIIGKNDGWKQESKMGKKNNQHFQFIPFNNLIQKIQYKAFMNGIEVEFVEESYTSKASFFDKDPFDNSRISGTRKHRGLYVSNGFAVNADVNGSLNIGRKVINVIGESYLNSKIIDRSLAARPVVINPLKSSLRITAENGLVAQTI